MGQIIDSHVMIYLLQGRYIPDLYDLYDLHDLAHVAGWELYYTDTAQHLGITNHNSRLGSRYLHNDLFVGGVQQSKVKGQNTALHNTWK